MMSVNRKITLRLGTGFGMVLLMMATVIVVGYTRFARVGEIHRQLVETNWVNAGAANRVAETTTANAREAMEGIITPNKEQFAEISRKIAANKQAVDDALSTLDRLLYTNEGKTLLEQIKQQRARYVASIDGVAQLNASGKREEATQLMMNTALPALAALQISIRSLSALQNRIADTNSASAQQEIQAAHRWMFGLGMLALVLGAACAYWIHRSLACPFQCCER